MPERACFNRQTIVLLFYIAALPPHSVPVGERASDLNGGKCQMTRENNTCTRMTNTTTVQMLLGALMTWGRRQSEQPLLPALAADHRAAAVAVHS